MNFSPRASFFTLILLLNAVYGSFVVSVVSAASETAHLDERLGIIDAKHLLGRSGIGAHSAEVDRLQHLTRGEAIELVLSELRVDPEREMPAWVNSAAPPYWATADMLAHEKTEFEYKRDAELSDLRRWWVREMIETTSPQSEKLVLFWSNHFATAYSGVGKESTSIARQHQLFRRLGFQNYRALLKAMLRDAALLRYLDNVSNRKDSPNENLARELLELYTLGEGHFSEQTVRTAARALTGWGVSPAGNMAFEFNRWDHDHQQKNLFGRIGTFDGDDLIDLLLEQPQASLHLASRFYQFYIAPIKSDSELETQAIHEIANQFRQHDYDLTQLLGAVLRHPAFWAAENRGALIKSPIDLYIGSIRSTGFVPSSWNMLPAHLASSGQVLFDPPNVLGGRDIGLGDIQQGIKSQALAAAVVRIEQSKEVQAGHV